MKKLALFFCALSTAICVSADSDKPRVLLIGDSISSGYGGTVRSALEGEAIVIRAPGNASASARGLAKPTLPKYWVDPEKVDDPANPANQKKKRKRPMQTNAAGKVPVPTDYETYIDYYLAHGPFDVIHFNWGLHDLKRGGIPKDEYVANLTKLVARMQKTDAVLIFATTTPVPENNKEKRIPAKVVEFNEAAIALMKEKGVHVNDLYAAIVPHQKKMQLENNVHFERAGYSFLGKQVAASIQQVLDAQTR